MQQTFKTLDKQDLTIDSGLIGPFDFSEMLKKHYILADQFHVKAFIPKELTDAPHYNDSIALEVYKQTAVYNKLMYDPAIFSKLVKHTDEILSRPEFFLLRFPALFINHEIKQENTTFTLGSLLESWKHATHLYSVDDKGEIWLISMLYPRMMGSYRYRAWSPASNDFTETGILGSTDNIINEFEMLNQRYPWQLKENHKYALELLEKINKF